MAGSKKALGILFGVKGGDSISKDSGKLILDDLHSIVRQINSNQKLLPKVVFRLDVTKSLKSIDKLQKAVTVLQNQINNINMPNSGGNGGGNGSGNGGNKKSAEFTKLTENLKEYVKQAKELDKVSKRTKSVDAMANGAFDTKSQDYAKQVEHINKLASSYQRLKALLNDSSGKGSLASRYPQRAANLLGISVEELKTLEAEYNKFQAKIEINSEKNSKSANDAWLKNATKVSDSIHRMYDTISKDPSVKRMADRILEMTKQGSGNVDDLNAEFQRLNLKIRETGAGIETWEQKFKKAFGNHVRSALASLITLDIGQVLRGVYDNVVQLDDAVVNLQIASGKSRIETKALVKEYAALAKQLKATTAEVSASADTWLRQGYNAAQATTLITNSTMLSKLGQMEAADASTALTSAMKGYKIAVEDSVNIVDKLTAVDMEAAASAGGIATAMAETSASANLAGVSMDTLIGYIATVKEVTQDSDESVGTFFKTMLARMGNIKVGKFVDEDGESLNDVEAVLGEVGIKLRSDSEHFRDFSEVLDEVGAKWEGYNEVQKHAIATAIAGTRQQEKFLTLMSNYGAALGYAEVAANSAGTAIDKYGAYTEGVTGKLQELKATFEELSLTALDSDTLSQFIGLATSVTEIGTGLFKVIEYLGGLPTLLTMISGILITIKANSVIKMATQVGDVGKTIAGVTKALALVIPKFIAARAAGTSFGDSLTFAFEDVSKSASAAQIAIGLVTTTITLAVAAIGAIASTINAHNAKVEAAASNLLDSAKAHTNNAQGIAEEVAALTRLIEEYDELASREGWQKNEQTLKRAEEIQKEIVGLVGEQKKGIDLVNGALTEQKGILEEISKDRYNALKFEADKAKSDAISSYSEIVKKAGQNEVKFDVYYDYAKAKANEDLLNEYGVDNWIGQFYSRYKINIQTEYNDIEQFVAQYENLMALQEHLINSEQVSEYQSLYAAINSYQKEYGDYYKEYIEAVNALQRLEDWRNQNNEPNSEIVKYKGIKATLEDVAPAYDALAKAVSNLGDNRILTADALSSLLELEKDGKIGGVETAKLITETAEGYKLATDALEQYVEALVNAAILEAKVNHASEESRDNAIKNLETLVAVLATLSSVQEKSQDPSSSLEAEKDALDERLDKYKELIDLRKDLIETYVDELEYQRELEKKQQKVSSLQTKLAVARLDNSAAGQARVRELESQLQEAQEDLDDFTLEHAIEEILDGLDNQYSEYENLIKSELEKIEDKLDALKHPDSIKISGLDGYIAQLQSAISEVASVVEIVKQESGLDELPGKPLEYVKMQEMMKLLQFALSTELRMDVLHNSGRNQADIRSKYATAWEDVTNLMNLGNEARAQGLINDLVIASQRIPTMSEEASENFFDEWFKKNKTSSYHSGGFVGGEAGLQHNEEFAKLMKKEFVSTPAQIQRFMTRTLPQIASIGGTNPSQEFNAPLIEINCESVTSESMPQLKQIINEAVSEIKKCLDDGMSRTGYKRTVKKLLT